MNSAWNRTLLFYQLAKSSMDSFSSCERDAELYWDHSSILLVSNLCHFLTSLMPLITQRKFHWNAMNSRRVNNFHSLLYQKTMFLNEYIIRAVYYFFYADCRPTKQCKSHFTFWKPLLSFFRSQSQKASAGGKYISRVYAESAPEIKSHIKPSCQSTFQNMFNRLTVLCHTADTSNALQIFEAAGFRHNQSQR